MEAVVKCSHFVMSHMTQNKNWKQTLKSGQYGLEIIFNINTLCKLTDKCIFVSETGHIYWFIAKLSIHHVHNLNISWSYYIWDAKPVNSCYCSWVCIQIFFFFTMAWKQSARVNTKQTWSFCFACVCQVYYLLLITFKCYSYCELVWVWFNEVLKGSLN